MTIPFEEEDLVWLDAWEEIVLNHPNDPIQFPKDKAMLEQAARNTIAKRNQYVNGDLVLKN